MNDALLPGRYRHYKGKEYAVIGIARHSETEEPMVVYQTLYGHFDWWVRPLSMFLETVTMGNGDVCPRFCFVGPLPGAALPVLRSES